MNSGWALLILEKHLAFEECWIVPSGYIVERYMRSESESKVSNFPTAVTAEFGWNFQPGRAFEQVHVYQAEQAG